MTGPGASPGLRWGILATGGIARLFANDLRVAGLDLAAVGSRSVEAANHFAHEFDVRRVHASYESLASDPEIDIVYIATPHPAHAANALLMLEHGKHVLIEKPFTLTGPQAEAVRQAADERGLLAMEAMWTRYLPHMARVREIIASGTLGPLRGLIADHTQRLPDDPTHRLNSLALGGGALLDLGIYPVSFAWDLFGAPTQVQASAHLKDTGVDAETAIILTHSGGELSSLFCSSVAAGTNTAVVLGRDARIEIDAVWYRPTTLRVVDAGGAVIDENTSRVDGRGMQYQALAAEDIVASGRRDSDLLPMDESVAIMRTLDEIRRRIGVAYPGAG